MIDKFEYKVIKSKEIWMQHEDNQNRIEEIQKYLNDLEIKDGN